MIGSREELELLIVPGAVFKLKNSNIHSVDPHYHVILNSNPITDPDIVFVVASTNVKTRLKHAERVGRVLSSLVIMDNPDCEFLSDKTVFDCNDLCALTKGILFEKFDGGDLDVEKHYKVSNEVLNKLRKAVYRGSASDHFKELIPIPTD